MSHLTKKHLSPLGSWEHLQERWEAAESFGEIEGLLHHGQHAYEHDLHRANNLEETRQLTLRYVDFYIEVGELRGIGSAAFTAKQLLVKFWLREVRSRPAWELIPVHLRLLEFLGEGPVAGISGPPYPRFVSQYLDVLRCFWRGPEIGSQARLLHEALVEHERLFVLTHCYWGLGHLFLGEDERPLEYLREFLQDRAGGDLHLLYHFADALKVPEDLSGGTGHREATRRAQLALLIIEGWRRHGALTFLPEGAAHDETMRCVEKLLQSMVTTGRTSDEILAALGKQFHLVPKH